LNIAVFVSGRGSNLKAILASEELKELVEVKAVISDKISCPAFQIAKSFSIPTYSVLHFKLPKAFLFRLTQLEIRQAVLNIES